MNFFYNASAWQGASVTPMPSKARAIQTLRSITKTLVLTVKLAAVLILTTCLQVSAKTINAQKVSISLKNSSLEKLFLEIEKKTSYVFFYDVAILKGTKPVTVEMKDATVESILQASLKGQALDFSINDRTIFVKKGGDKPVVVAPEPVAPGEGATVTGVVKSEKGVPLMGASIAIRKLKKYEMTNSSGEFVVKNVPNGEYEVEISFVGYQTHKTMVRVENNQVRMVADLKESHSSLDETVVKGYYSTTHRMNTGNVTTVKGEDIQKQPVGDPMMALQGRVAGLYITQASGIPGANLNVQLRGQNSISSGNNPFYIVDGVPFTSTTLSSSSLPRTALGGGVNTNNNTINGISPFSILNPADIESIEVLKDADATAIYGSRGANGVILITTKKGKIGASRVDFNVYSGIGKVDRKMALLNTQQYLRMRHEAFYNDSIVNPAANIKPAAKDNDLNGNWDTTRYTDWQKEFIGGTAHFTNAQVSLSGGNTNTQFVLGGGYSRQTTVFPGNYSDQKASVHFSLNHTSSNRRFHSIFSAQYVHDNNIVPTADFTGNITLAPDAPTLYDANGAINWQNNTWTNPIAATLKQSRSATDNLIGNLNLSYDILPGLQLRSSLGYTRMQLNQTILNPAAAFYGPPSPSGRSAYFDVGNINTWIIEPQVSYVKRISQGKLDVLIGTTWQQNSQNDLAQYASGFASDALISNMGMASSISLSGNNSTDYRYNAIFGRVGYTWQEKYLLNLTARRDGSSRFGPGNKFGNFGAVGAGWIFSREKFASDALPWLSFGKIRASYGTTGNDQITDYQYLSAYSSNASSNYQGVVGLQPARIANPYFGWEIVKKLEGGIELGFLHDRILITTSYYRNRTDNQLVGQTLPSMDGFTSIQANLPAVVENTGIEITLNTINIQSKDFTWTSSVNLSIPRNKLVSYPGLTTSSNKTKYVIGQPLTIQYLFHFTGMDQQTGVYTIQDVDKDGKYTGSDFQFSKSKTQNYFGGVQNNFSYKGLQLDVFFQFVKQTGSSYLSSFSGAPGSYSTNPNQPGYVLDHWSRPGSTASVQKYTQSSGVATSAYSYIRNSDFLISDASFIRLKNLALSYSLPQKWQHTAHLQNARIYIQCQNLITFTSYKGLDPETQGLNLPPLRMMTAGVQVGL